VGLEVRVCIRPRIASSTPTADVAMASRRAGRNDAGRKFWLWRAVDDEGEVLDLLVPRRRDKAAAVKLMRKLLKKQGFAPDVLVTDKLRSYGAARSDCRPATSKSYGRTIGTRIRINRHDGVSARSSVSNRPDQPNGSFPFTPPSTTHSTSSVISLPAARSRPKRRSVVASRDRGLRSAGLPKLAPRRSKPV
jgi:transposase-like protein